MEKGFDRNKLDTRNFKFIDWVSIGVSMISIVGFATILVCAIWLPLGPIAINLGCIFCGGLVFSMLYSRFRWMEMAYGYPDRVFKEKFSKIIEIVDKEE